MMEWLPTLSCIEIEYIIEWGKVQVGEHRRGDVPLWKPVEFTAALAFAKQSAECGGHRSLTLRRSGL